MRSIFITGRSCRLPGAPSVEAFARLLQSGGDAVTEIPDDRWTKSYFLHPVPGTKGKTYTFAAGVVEDLWGFDPSVFGISPREVGQMDPQQRMLLQVAWEALEDAGLPPEGLRGQRVGVYVGCSAMAHAARLSQDAAVTDAYLMTGNTLALVSNRISHVLDLRGPSMTVDTACSSSLVALGLARDALMAGVVDVAVVAGVNALLDPFHYVGFSAARMLSPKGRCQPFSAAADGYVRAEGAVAFVLERTTAQALRPRRAHAVLRGVETNTDGWTVNVALPSAEGQADLLRRAYAAAAVDPSDLLFVEAHGTGTLAGDPVEAQALGRVLGAARSVALPIGSVKSNIGHLEPASGAAGLLKALVALETGVFPGTLHFEAPNPAIPLEALNLAVSAAPIRLEEGGSARFAGVSSFGFGGANAHAILERVPPEPAPRSGRPAVSGVPILRLSAFAEASLRQSLAAWRPLVAGADDGMDEVCAEARQYRGLYPRRAAVICATPEAAAEAMTRAAAGGDHPLIERAESALVEAPAAFVFSGNGSQYPGMGLAALAGDRDYAKGLRRIDREFRKLGGWSIIARMQAPDLAEQLRDAAVAQPLLFADQVAMAGALKARGLWPAAVMGHSGGEVAAAHVAGILTLEEALTTILWRSLRAASLRGKGTMGAVQASVAEVSAALAEAGPGIGIAAVNSPRSVTLVGEAEALEAFLRHARRHRRWPAVRLAIDYPYHGAAMAVLREPLRRDLAGLRPGAGDVTFVSSVTGRAMQGEELDAAYWCDNLCRPVAFVAAMQTLQDMGLQGFVEIGSSPVLQSYMQDCLAGMPAFVMPSGERRAEMGGIGPVDRIMARAVAGGLRVTGRLGAKPRGMRRDLPRYCWANETIRIDRSAGILNRLGDAAEARLLLGREEWLDAGVWRTELDPHLVPEFADHRIGGRILVPATAFWEMALQAAAASLGYDGAVLEDVDLLSPVALSRQGLTEMQTRVAPGDRRITIGARSRGQEGGYRPILQSLFTAHGGPAEEPAVPDPAASARDRDGAEIYAAARRRGLDYGPAFARARRFRKLSETVGEVFLDTDGPSIGGRWLLDVIGADAALHGLIGLIEDMAPGRSGLGFLPVRAARVEVLRGGRRVAMARLHLLRMGERSILADIDMFDAEGEGLARVRGLRLQAVRLVRDVSLTQHAFRQIALPVGGEDGAADAGGGGLGDLILAASGDAALVPQDDGSLLADAAAQAVAAEALAALVGAGGTVPSAMRRYPYVDLLAEICLRARLAEARAGDVVLLPEGRGAEAPGARGLIDFLAEACPERVSERLALVQLRAELPGLLKAVVRGEAVPEVEALFGRDLLAALAEGGIGRRRAVTAAVKGVAGLVEGRQAGPALRIAVVADGTDGLLRGLVHRIGAEAAVLTEILMPGGGRGSISAGLPADRVSVMDWEALKPAGAGLFDIVLSVGALTGLLRADDVLAVLAGALRPDGQFIAMEPAPGDLDEMLHGLAMVAEGGVRAAFGEGHGARLAEDWAAALVRAGLDKVEVRRLPDGCAGATLAMARARAGAVRTQVAGDPDLAATVAEALEAAALVTPDRTDGGIVVRRSETDGMERIILAMSPAGQAGAAVLGARILALRDMVEALPEGARLICVVPGGSGLDGGPGCPVQGATWTFLRSVVNEYPLLSLRRHDVAPGLDAAEAGRRIAACEAGQAGEGEMLHAEGQDFALRVIHGSATEEARGGPEPGSEGTPDLRSVLRAVAGGGLDDLRWELEPRRAPGEGEVEIEVEAAGLNYRDVMWAMGLLPEEALEAGFAGPHVGIECAGRVLRCGPGCTGLSPGDRVVTFGPECMASHLVAPAGMVTKLPEGVGPEAAATLPVAFFTAWHGLVSLAALAAGEWVLIHGGAGGVGLAAIQIAQMRGSRIIATAGNPVKRALLRDMGVAHVLDSRSLDFAEEVRRLTDGRGVDVVLNALAGEAMERSLRCLAPLGRFVELGKQDFLSNSALRMRVLRENVSYFAVDMDQVMAERPAAAGAVFADIMSALRQQRLSPLPLCLFEGAEAVQAFRLMQKSGHVGKIVLRPMPPSDLRRGEPAIGSYRPAAEGWHLVVGGLGGLGIEVVEWLAEAGARRIALMGRRIAPDPAAQAAIARWRGKGIDLRLLACDVADEAALRTALETLTPLAGVIHSAMVLEDMPLARLTDEVLARVLPAKVEGSRNLDRLTRDSRLDYFVLFTSLATLIGNHGQSAYVAANGYMEAIVRQRRAEGLPGLAIGWGGIGDVGYLARDQQRAAMVRRMSGNVEFTGVQAVRALERLLAMGRACAPVVHVSPMGWQAVASTLPMLSEPAFALLRQLGRREGGDVEDEDLRTALTGMTRDRAEARIRAWLVGRIARILQVPEASVAVTKPASELGIDSLMGVELGLTLQEALGDDIPTTAVSDSLSIDEIGARIIRHLHGEADAGGGEARREIRVAVQHLAIAQDAAGAAEAAE